MSERIFFLSCAAMHPTMNVLYHMTNAWIRVLEKKNATAFPLQLFTTCGFSANTNEPMKKRM